MKYSWVAPIAWVSDQSDNFYFTFHEFQGGGGPTPAAKWQQKGWFTLKIKGLSPENPPQSCQMIFILCAHKVSMSTVDCESFGSISQLLLHFFMIFREGRGPTLAAKWLQRGYRKVYLHWKSMFWAPKLHLELSDGLHTLCTWSTHEYCRLREFRINRTIFTNFFMIFR